MIQPRISLTSSQSPSNLSNFLSKMGLPPLWSVILGGGKMLCIPWSMARVVWRMWSCVAESMQPIKSSTKTSMRARVMLMSDIGRDENFFGSILDSNGCGGSGVERSDAMMPRAVSEAAQKSGGDSQQPICRLVGTTIFVTSIVFAGSKEGIT